MQIESEEKIKKPSNTKKAQEKDKQIIEDVKQRTRQKFLYKIVLLTSILIVIAILSFLVILFLRKEKREVSPNPSTINTNGVYNFTSFKNIITEEKNNSISAVYSLQKEEKLALFNPEKINLSNDNYEIEVLSIKDDDSNSTSTSSIRNLNDIDYQFISTINGKLEIRINFFIQLTSMLELFKDCRNLIEIDLSSFDGSKLENVNSVFENCDNLVFTNLNLKNGNMIQSMDNCFSGCNNLKDVDLTDFKPQKNVSIQNMFKNCAKLNYVDLSNFQTNNYQGIFMGAINLLLNINIDININSLIWNISDLINSLQKKKFECEIGEGPKCKSCMEDMQYCGECNEGYYLPYKKRELNV